jgi:uncharacterized protein YcaQ
MPKAPVISRVSARRIALATQGLQPSWQLLEGADGVVEALMRLGYVQIDAIRVVQRAHHHVLWTRQPAYHPSLLETVVKSRQVFEYTIPFAAYLPTSDFRFYLREMHALAPIRPQVRRALLHHKPLTEYIVARIRREGPLEAADYPVQVRGKRSWGNRGEVREVLKALAATGVLMVTERRSFRPVYDLVERVLPSDTDTREPTSAEWARHAVQRSLSAFPLVSAQDIYWCGSRTGIHEALRDLEDEGKVTAVKVAGLSDGTRYVLTSSLKRSHQDVDPQRAVHILSPFDGLVTNRKRLKALFAFDYKSECYLPKRKRQWGYFCLPLLWGDVAVGRVDSSVDRNHDILVVRRLLLEQKTEVSHDIAKALAEQLAAFAEFNDCRATKLETVKPVELKWLMKAHM